MCVKIRPMTHRIAALAVSGGGLFELGIVAEVFGLARPEVDGWPYALITCAAGPVASTAGLRMLATHGLEDLASADTVIVPAAGDVDAEPDPRVVAALRAADLRGARMVSICSGAFLLAAAGVLDGRRVTTHWRYADRLAQRFPTLRVDPDVIYVGDERVITSAGSAAGIDVCLELVRRDLGATAANAVARRLVVPPHRDGGQAQFVELPVPARADDDRIAAVMDWAVAHLAEPLNVETMARRAFMSVRTFSRHFQLATGTSPGRWLLEQRVRASLPLLEDGDDSVETIAARVGFNGAGAYRHHFGAAIGTSPIAYRRAFRTRSADAA